MIKATRLMSFTRWFPPLQRASFARNDFTPFSPRLALATKTQWAIVNVTEEGLAEDGRAHRPCFRPFIPYPFKELGTAFSNGKQPEGYNMGDVHRAAGLERR
jgi:hypothetical protein